MIDIGEILQFIIQNKWTIAVVIPVILVIIILKFRG